MHALTPALASKFATLALNHVRREYPNKVEHILNDPRDARPTRELHPLFYGSFDWHSCVHGYWLLARVLRRVDDAPEAARIRALFDEQFTARNVEGELAYLRAPNRGTFERPYGWGWLLMLAAELRLVESGRWAKVIEPLATDLVHRFREFLPKATYPIRSGAHFNTAFAVVLAFEYARVTHDAAFHDVLRDKADNWYGADADCQAWEPGGDDFLSPALIEAECMRRALPDAEFVAWLGKFLPRLAAREPATLFVPASVSDRTDGKIGHLDGLNFSRAWCWRSLARSMPASDPRRGIALETAHNHIDTALPHVADDYAGEHWLATFAMLALEA